MNSQTHVDVDTLNMLKEIMEDGFSNLLETYLSDSKIRIEEIRKALAAGDSDTVRRAAHSLKGSSGNLGANALAAICLNIENRGKEENLEGLDVELANAEQEFQHVAIIMEEML